MGVSWSWGQSQLEFKFEFQQIGRFCDMSSSDNGVLDSGHTGYDPYTGSRGRATQPGPSMRFSSGNAPSWPSASWRLKPRRILVSGRPHEQRETPALRVGTKPCDRHAQPGVHWRCRLPPAGPACARRMPFSRIDVFSRRMQMIKSLTLMCLSAAFLFAQTNTSDKPTWWTKYQELLHGAFDKQASAGTSPTAANVDVSNECGPQSETYNTVNPSDPASLAAGSNEIFRLPMRGYFSSDGGGTWGGVDLPLPPALGANGTRFGSDPSLAFDSS